MRTARTTIVRVLAVIAIVAGGWTRAEAIPLAPGSTVPALPIAFPGGVGLASVYYTNQGDADLLVDVGSSVVRAAGGTLDFYYQVTNNSPGPTFDQVHRLTGSSFAGWITDVWWVVNGAAVPCAACGGTFQNGTQDPFNVDRSSGVGSVVGFNFPIGFEVDPGETSTVLLIRTDARNFRPGFVSVINSGTVTRPAFEPTIGVLPEPATLSLVGFGLFAAGIAMRRRFKR